MALDGVEFSVDEGPEWNRVVAALDDVSATLASRIRDAVSHAVDPWMTEAQANVATMPIKGIGRQSGLRREVADSVNKDVTGSPQDFEVTVTSSLPHGVGEENEAAIPPGMDRDTGWRHPVFGNNRTWVTQVPLRHHWFTGVFDDRGNDVSNQIQDVLDEARDNISHAGA